MQPHNAHKSFKGKWWLLFLKINLKNIDYLWLMMRRNVFSPQNTKSAYQTSLCMISNKFSHEIPEKNKSRLYFFQEFSEIPKTTKSSLFSAPNYSQKLKYNSNLLHGQTQLYIIFHFENKTCFFFFLFQFSQWNRAKNTC